MYAVAPGFAGVDALDSILEFCVTAEIMIYGLALGGVVEETLAARR